jgi:hypothetical protein
MISASWPMPKSYIPVVQEKSEEDSGIKDLIKKNKIKFISAQKKGQKLEQLSESEQIILQDFLNEAMKELAAKVLLMEIKAISEGPISKPQKFLTHDLDDVYNPKAKVPFPNDSPQY